MEGVLRVRKDVELDRETIAFYNLTICARDRGLPPLSSTVSLQGPSHCTLHTDSCRHGHPHAQGSLRPSVTLTAL